MWEVFYFNIDLLKSLTGDCMIADLSESYEQNKREYTEEERKVIYKKTNEIKAKVKEKLDFFKENRL